MYRLQLKSFIVSRIITSETEIISQLWRYMKQIILVEFLFTFSHLFGGSFLINKVLSNFVLIGKPI